jgi:Cna protein B-type domain.
MTKGKLTKKIVALAATVMMLFAIAMPAMAAPNTGKITVHKLAGNSAGTIPNNDGVQLGSLPAGYAPLAGATFTLYRVNQAQLDALMASTSDTNTFVSHTVNPGVSPTVTFTLSGTGPATVNATMLSAQTTNAAGEAVFGPNLADGWYILQETVVPAGYDASEPSLIRLPMTSAGTPNYDVHVYPKNVSTEGLAIKEITGAPQVVTTGTIVPFELKARFRNLETLPANKVSSAADLRATTSPSMNPADYGNATITESFNTYFELSGTIAVRWLTATGDLDLTPSGLLTLGTHYTITTTPATAISGAIYAVSLTPAGIDAAIAQGKSGFGLQVNARYIGTPSAGQGTPDKLENKMVVNMQKAGGAPVIVIVDDETHIPSISIQVDKVKQEDGTPLAGVTFELATVPVPTLPSHYVTGAGGVRLTATTDTNGNVYFAHLPNYSDAAGITYYLVEVSTVPGYILPLGTTAVTFKSKMAYLADPAAPAAWFNGADWTSEAQIVEVSEIKNAKDTETPETEPGFSLPLTGGAGTVLFTAIGIVVMLGATIVYLNGKKKNI